MRSKAVMTGSAETASSGPSSRSAIFFFRCAALNLLVFLTPSWGLDPQLTIRQYLHTRWIQEEASDFPEVRALAQTADGYLWLGTTRGLQRFDGLRSVPWEPPTGEKALGVIRSL